jgi:hypothetical protein
MVAPVFNLNDESDDIMYDNKWIGNVLRGIRRVLYTKRKKERRKRFTGPVDPRAGFPRVSTLASEFGISRLISAYPHVKIEHGMHEKVVSCQV